MTTVLYVLLDKLKQFQADRRVGIGINTLVRPTFSLAQLVPRNTTSFTLLRLLLPKAGSSKCFGREVAPGRAWRSWLDNFYPGAGSYGAGTYQIFLRNFSGFALLPRVKETVVVTGRPGKSITIFVIKINY